MGTADSTTEYIQRMSAEPAPAQRFEDLQRRLAEFAAERDWDPFHSPKNLAMALAAEAGELLEHFQWLTEEQSATLAPEALEAVALELADIQLYLVRLADKLQINLVEAAHRKIEINAGKYPAAKARGTARKYTEF
jgi:dCTP diphosphatase